ncbi:hypothetical protein MFIFM68171_10311 [Madurella fahalii]|uniref:Alpha/beta hydrolase fold-3 domain-containing protein n=1 Tax=Madurella fahalii TaxID=1157608 RepID=A0ABQ0GQT4_9PEZI
MAGGNTHGTARGLACSFGKGAIKLGPVSYLDCLVFCVFLAPQLLWQVGFFETILCVFQAVPFLVVELPVAFIRGRYLVNRAKQSAFVRRTSPFEDFVVRCVRYAFANIPARVGKVFFAKEVAIPFLWFRLFRHGHLGSPIYWREESEKSFRGIWIIKEPADKPDFVLYYAHGGGFSMGSSYFYLEYFLTWLSVLSSSGYRNPAIFALEYTLVPDASFPTQVEEAMKGYEHVLSKARDPSIVCAPTAPKAKVQTPTGISIGSRNLHLRDYLDAQQLHRYGRQFAGSGISETDPRVSPGCCNDISWWKRSSPSQGIFITYGTDEVLAPDIEGLVDTLRNAGVIVESKPESGGIHAWPVASLFLSSSRDDRLDGLMTMTREIRQRIPSNGVRD